MTMRMSRGRLLGGAIRGIITPSLRMSENDKYIYETFNAKPTCGTKADHLTSPTGTDGDENVCITDRNSFEYHMIGAHTVLEPIWGATGLNLAFSQVDDEGVEFTSGGVVARGRNIFTVGTSPAFFLRVHFDIEDVSGTDDCAVGFRKVEAYQAAIDAYDELACMNVISGNITIETILNDATATSTDTLNDWGDTEDHTLTVRVSEAGVVTYEIDDAAPVTTAAFTFDDTEVVTPFMYCLEAANLSDAIYLRSWECGYQSAVYIS